MKMQNFQGIVFIRTQTDRKIFKLHYCTFSDTYLDFLEYQQQQQKRISTKTYFSEKFLK